MGLRIKTNVESLKAQKNLGKSNQRMQQSMERLSSGQRINRSADDAAGLAVSERIRARVQSLEVSKRNASDAISYIQVAEGGLNEVTNIVVRMRELASQSASDTIGNRERSFLDKEFQELKSEVQRITEATEFNGSKVLQVGEDGVEPLQIFVGSSNRADATEDLTPENDPDILTINLDDLETLSSNLETLFQENMAVIPDREDLSVGGATDLGGNTNDVFESLDSALKCLRSFPKNKNKFQNILIFL